jgi:hypothetical protein
MKKKKVGRPKGLKLTDMTKERITDSLNNYFANLKAKGLPIIRKKREKRQEEQPIPQAQPPALKIPEEKPTVPLEVQITKETQPIMQKQLPKQENSEKTQTIQEKPTLTKKNEGVMKIWTLAVK